MSWDNLDKETDAINEATRIRNENELRESLDRERADRIYQTEKTNRFINNLAFYDLLGDSSTPTSNTSTTYSTASTGGKHNTSPFLKILVFAIVPTIFLINFYSSEIDRALKKHQSHTAKIDHRVLLEEKLNICAMELLKKKMGNLTPAEIQLGQKAYSDSPYKDHNANEFKQILFNNPLSPFYGTSPTKLTVNDGVGGKAQSHTYNGDVQFKIKPYLNKPGSKPIALDPTIKPDQAAIAPYDSKNGSFHPLNSNLHVFTLSAQVTTFNQHPGIPETSATSVEAEMTKGQALYALGKAEIPFTTDANYQHATFFDGNKTLVQKQDGTIGYIDHSELKTKDTNRAAEKVPMQVMAETNVTKQVQAFADRLVEQKGRELTMEQINASMKAFDGNPLAGVDALKLMTQENVTRSPFFASNPDTVMINGEPMPVRVFSQIRPQVFSRSDRDLIPFDEELKLRKRFDQIGTYSIQVVYRETTEAPGTASTDTSILGRMKAGWTSLFAPKKKPSDGWKIVEARFAVAFDLDGSKIFVLDKDGKELLKVGPPNRDLGKVVQGTKPTGPTNARR